MKKNILLVFAFVPLLLYAQDRYGSSGTDGYDDEHGWFSRNGWMIMCILIVIALIRSFGTGKKD